MFEKFLVLLLGGALTVTSFIDSPDMLTISFEKGQKFYATQDYIQALEKYEAINEVESRFIKEENVEVAIGDMGLPVKIAATYQMGNCYMKLAIEDKGKAEELDEREAEERNQLMNRANDRFDKAIECFQKVVREAKLEDVRVQSQYSIVKCLYEAERYEEVVDAANLLIDNYSNPDYVSRTLYELGWSYYYLAEYDSSIAVFNKLIEVTPEGHKADRARFQIGMCYFHKKEYETARDAFEKLLGKYEAAEFTEAERARMEAKKLGGVVTETIVELNAKAKVQIGDCHKEEGDCDKAIETYLAAIDEYSTELELVKNTYLKIGKLYIERNQLEDCIKTYRKGIDKFSDKELQAKLHFQIASEYFDQGLFEQAIKEYDLYMAAYKDVAKNIGLGLDKAQYKIASAFFELGLQAEAAGDVEKAKEYYAKSSERYEEITKSYSYSKILPEAYLGMGLAEQKIATPDSRNKALKTYRLLMKKYSRKPEISSRALLQVARLYSEQKEFEESVKTYQEFIEQYPNSVDINSALVELGMAHFEIGQSEEAINVLSEVEQDSDLKDEAVLLMSQIYLRNEQYSEAKTVLIDYTNVAKNPALLPQLHIGLAKVYMEEEAYAEAIDEFAKAETPEASEELLRNSIFGRGFCYYQMDDFANTEKNLERLLQIGCPEDIKSQTYRMLGMSLVKQGKKKKAIENYKVLIESSETLLDRVEFSTLLTELYYDTKEYDQAIINANKLIELEFEDVNEAERGYSIKERAYFLIGDSYYKMGDYANAISYFEVGIEKFPDHLHASDMIFLQAVSYFNTRGYMKAIDGFKAYMSKYPTGRNIEMAEYYLAYSLFSESFYNEAGKEFTGFIKRFPKSSLAGEAQYQVGENYFNVGKYEDAIGEYEKVTTNYQKSDFVDDATYNIGWCYLELAEEEKGISYFRKVVSDFPLSEYAPSAQFSLGDYYFNVRDYKNALVEYKRLVDNYSTSTLKPKAELLIDELHEILAYVRYAEGMKFFDKGEYEEAVAIFQEVVEQYLQAESRAGALCNMGMSYEHKHKWKKAVEAFDTVVKDYEGVDAQKDALRFAKEHRDWIVENRL